MREVIKCESRAHAANHGKRMLRALRQLIITVVVQPRICDIAMQQRVSEIYPRFFESLPSMAGKTVAVTGASRGLGFVTAKSLAMKGAAVILLNRRSTTADDARTHIAEVATGPPPVAIECDLCDFASVRRAAAEVGMLLTERGLDVLCLNAGIMLQPDVPSKDGYDITAQTNVLSHFLLTRTLMPCLERAASQRGEARISSMSSGSGFGPPSFDARFYARMGGRLGGQQASYARYHQSKLANLLFTSALHRKLSAKGSRIMALACTPGVCATDMFVHVQTLSRPSQPVDLGRVPSVEDGSCAQLKCLCDRDGVRSGQLWGPPGLGGWPAEVAMAPPTVLVDASAEEALWRCCEQATGPFEL